MVFVYAPDTEMIQRWVDALRSGDYKQGQSALRDDKDKFCCLGVLCDISEQGRWIRQFESSTEWAYSPLDEDDYMRTGFLPAFVANKIGVDVAGYLPSTHGTSNEISLIKLNDRGVPFSKIADHIEREYLQ